MKKSNAKKSSFECRECGKNYLKWLGCCTSCNAWESIVEVVIENSVETYSQHIPVYEVSDIWNVQDHSVVYETGISEWDRVLGKGLVKGSFILLTGEPGVGKSTLLLQVVHALAKKQKVLYVSSEESIAQVMNRIKRLSSDWSDTLLLAYSTHTGEIIETIIKQCPEIVIIDSLQNCSLDGEFLTIASSAVRIVAHQFLTVAKEKNITLIVTGHITKDGAVAGPKMLEHIVDVVLHIYADENSTLRVLRASKNRFGSTEEAGFFIMQEHGMIEQKDEAGVVLESYQPRIGSALTTVTEGSRTFIIEVQALTVPVKYGNPQRVITGIDHKQLILICAVLERYVRMPLHSHDIFCKVSGGFKVKNNIVHAALAAAIMSSFLEKPLKEVYLLLGEIGLTAAVTMPSNNFISLALLKKYGLKTLVSPVINDDIFEKERLKHDISHVSLTSAHAILSLFSR